MNPEKQPGAVNPYEVLVPIEKIESAQTFDELYKAIQEIRATDADFCSNEMMQSIYNIEGARDPNLARVPGVFSSITRKYGLRDKVTGLVRMMPPKVVQASEKPASPKREASDDSGDGAVLEGFTPQT